MELQTKQFVELKLFLINLKNQHIRVQLLLQSQSILHKIPSGRLIAMRAGQGRPEAGLRLVGAHTDSPNLSVKPNPVKGRDGCVQLGVDVYGGALLTAFYRRLA